MSKDISHENTDEIVCPYCGYEFSDSYELADDETVTCHGDECEKKFTLQTERTIKYTTGKLDCTERKMEHQWGDAVYETRGQEIADAWNAEKFLGRTDWKDEGRWERKCAACDYEETKNTELGAPNPWGVPA